ncbi:MULTISPECIES: PaaI family thioesterase [unclassified Bacillus (in: firmicutes)]|uniref:PaaI family thioesterase n=1 Tax=unclassified Bacillus (in: firmicutes) TaxID=185979 RepID=UPI001BEB40DE|nr:MULTISPECIES: PaaI family thioesterase [unclassified Bacillus (in: firmicutes)]MBT2638320.1 PaaI family thioesterase [Bacillus sp. ISL-39]MBT2661324.1 PaaI family thioesterase [Bacillus sp. ISL-45]
MEEKVLKAIQDEYPEDFAWCYGCGRMNEQGHHFRTGWDGDKTISIYNPQKEHMALPGFVYGGVIGSFVDCHGTGSAALYLHRKNGYEPGDGAEPPRFVTASLHVDFMKPTPQGTALKAIGTVHEIHPKKYRVETEVYAGETFCAKGEVIAVVMPDTFTGK